MVNFHQRGGIRHATLHVGDLMTSAFDKILVVRRAQVGAVQHDAALGKRGWEGDVSTTFENAGKERYAKDCCCDKQGIENEEIHAWSHRKEDGQFHLLHFWKNDTSFHT